MTKYSVALAAAAAAVASASSALSDVAGVIGAADVEDPYMIVKRKLGKACSRVVLEGGHDSVYYKLGVTNRRPIYGAEDGSAWVLGYIAGGLDDDTGTRKLVDLGGEEHEFIDGDYTQWLKHKEALQSLSMDGESSPSKMFAAAKDGVNSLAECSDGFWVHFDVSEESVPETFPIYVTPDCALDPAEISTSWFRYDAVDSLPTSVEITIECAEASVEMTCIKLGSSGCERKGDCCNANEYNEEVKCWDERCCSKTGHICRRDKECCDGLSCMDGQCKKEPGCVSLGESGCAKRSDCCHGNDNNKQTKCKRGRCCNKTNLFCSTGSDCCPGDVCHGSMCGALMEGDMP